MVDTRRSVDIDLTAVPAQRVSPEDTLEVIQLDAPVAEAAVAPTSVAAPPGDRRMWLALLAIAVAAGFAIGVPAGVSMAPQPAPAPSPEHNDIDGLLLDPLGAQPPQPASPVDQQDLIDQMLTPPAP